MHNCYKSFYFESQSSLHKEQIQIRLTMKSSDKAQDDIKLIRQMMEESSKTLSLTGLSGIMVGLIALLGAAIAYFVILKNGTIQYDEYIHNLNNGHTMTLRWYLVIDAIFVLISALGAAWYLSYRYCQKKGVKFWTLSAKHLVSSLFTVLIIGGLFTIILLFQGYFKIAVPSMLLFYGLALLNASKYSQHDIKSLAFTMITLGLISAILLQYGLVMWSLGFGVSHIIYGTVMYFKYDLKS